MQFADEYEQAARRELPAQSHRRPYQAIAASSTAIAAIAAGTVLAIGATSGASPAYALTQNSDGSVTISLDNLTTGISQLNTRLQQVGIDYTVIPVTAGCATTTPVLDVAPGSLNETITIGSENTEPAGVSGYLAAEQLPNGQIGLAVGGMKSPLPSCFAPSTLTTQPSSSGATSSARRARQTRQVVVTATTTDSAPLPLSPTLKRHLKAKLQQGNPGTATTTSTPPVTTTR